MVGLNNNEVNFRDPAGTYDLTPFIKVGSANTLSITIVNKLGSGSSKSWSSNPGGVAYAITSGGSIVTASDGTEQSSGKNASIISSNLLYPSWISISGANWIWDADLLSSATASSR